MRTNLDKWNFYLSIINKKTNDFINEQKVDYTIPDIIYTININGKISKKQIIGIEYLHYKHKGKIYFKGKKPTKNDINEIINYSNSDISFTKDNIILICLEILNNDKEVKSSIGFNDVISKKNVYHSIEEAEKVSKDIIDKFNFRKEFKEKHKKDKNYNYISNGYKFLGWQNGWKHEYYDEDDNLCSISGKPSKKFGYSKDNYPEYRNCIDSGHIRIEVSHNTRGTENTVSCPICKIYWKYDCSD